MKSLSIYLKKTVFTLLFFFITLSVVNAANYFSIASGNWTANTTWSLTSGGAPVGAGIFPLAGDNVTIQGGFNVTLDANSACAAVTINGGTLDIATFTANVGSVTLINGNISGTTGILTGTSYAMQSGTVSAILGGVGIPLNKTTAGTVTLSGMNTYTGITTISAGILSVGTIGDGGVAGNLGAATNAAANLVLFGATLQYTGATASTDRNFMLSSNITTIDITTGASILTISGAFLNTSGTLIKTGLGTLQLSGTNLYNGLTTVNAGTLLYGINNALSSGGVTANGGIFDIATFTDAVGTVTLISGNIAGTTGVLTSTGNYQMQSGTASAILAGFASLVKSTAGTVTLSGTNTYSGGTLINPGGGTLVAANIQALGTGTGVNLNGGTLELATDVSINAYNISNSNSNAIITIVSNRATSGAGITHTQGTLNLSTGSTLNVTVGSNVAGGIAGLTFGTTTFSGGVVFDVATAANLTLGALSGNVAFSKQNNGQVTLNTASTRTGGIATLTAGTMKLGIVNALGTTGVPLTLNGGILDLATDATVNAYNTTIGGDVTIISNRATAGAGITHVLGTLSMGANTLTIDKGTNATSGTSSVQFGNLTMTGAPILNTNTANLIMAGTATGAFKLTKSGAGTLQKTTTAWTLGSDFEITAGTYDATTQNTTIPGNWINNGGTHTASGASTVTFNGSGAQSIGGSSATTFNNLTIDNTSGVSLGNNETVNAALTLTNGNLTIPAGNTFTIVNGNAIGGTGFSAAKSIVTQVNTGTGAKGFVRVNNMATSAAYSLPVGDGTNFLPVTLTPSEAPANNSYTVCAYPGITTNGEPNGIPFDVTQKSRCVDAVWTVNYNAAGTPSTTMLVGWPASLEGVNFTGYSNIGIAHWDGPNWGVPNGTGDNVLNTATRNAITAFSPFAVGNPDYLALAIKITYFNAAKGNGYNTVYWQASCSSSQATFELLRSYDGSNFTSINTITVSQARCAQPFNYQDNTALPGTVYYRLKVIDVDGKVSYSAIVKLSGQAKDMELTGIVPNPVANNAQLMINTSRKDVLDLAVISADGKVVYRNNVQLQPGSSIINLDIANLPTGMYMIKGMFSNGQSNTLKFLKK